jgi:hypothetical protein
VVAALCIIIVIGIIIATMRLRRLRRVPLLKRVLLRLKRPAQLAQLVRPGLLEPPVRPARLVLLRRLLPRPDHDLTECCEKGIPGGMPFFFSSVLITLSLLTLYSFGFSALLSRIEGSREPAFAPRPDQLRT